MKFDVVVGNPPYQKNSGTSARDDAMYHYFYELAEKIGNKYSLISPARFLFNAGSTPKDWNKKMLNDPHLKVLYYEPDSSKVFQNVGIAGGIAVLYRDTETQIGPIGSFTSFKELNTISQTVAIKKESSISTIISGRGIYRLTPQLHEDFPEVKKMQSKGHQNDIGTGAFDKFFGTIFLEEIPAETNDEFIPIQGRYNNARMKLFIKSMYVNQPFAFDKWRVILPKAYGTGISEKATAATLIGEPFVIEPYVGFTETYISIGQFDSQYEAKNALKYIKCKFTRALLAVLKVTQDNTKEKWNKVPLQDFTSDSDIDWSQTISNIDQQLYKKYGLEAHEIQFIESKVKGME